MFYTEMKDIGYRGKIKKTIVSAPIAFEWLKKVLNLLIKITMPSL